MCNSACSLALHIAATLLTLQAQESQLTKQGISNAEHTNAGGQFYYFPTRNIVLFLHSILA